MAITLDPELEREIEQKARQRGYTSPSDYLRDLFRRDQAATSNTSATRGEQFVAHLRGQATSGLSTEQIMEMTRGDG